MMPQSVCKFRPLGGRGLVSPNQPHSRRALGRIWFRPIRRTTLNPPPQSLDERPAVSPLRHGAHMVPRTVLTPVITCLLALVLAFGFSAGEADAASKTKKPKTEKVQQEEKPAWPSWLAEHAQIAIAYSDYLKGTSDQADAATMAERRVSSRELMAANNFRDARTNLERVLANASDDYTAWVLLAQTITYRSDDEDTIRRTATYHAWRTAKDDLDRSVALWVGREVSPDPIETEKMALVKTDRAKIAARLQTLIDNYPAEFIAIRVDSQAGVASGSACVAFTHSLLRPRVARYDDYVEVTPPMADVAVIANGRRLCVDGVPFGATVSLGLRAGLPGKDGRKLDQASAFDVVIPDRAPSLRFRESGFVLPSQGPQLVPLESVNMAAARVRVLRIVERNLIAALQSEFPNQQREWQVSNLAYGDAEKVFDGEVTLGGDKNKTKTTGLPVDELSGGSLIPGIYLIAVGPPGPGDDYGYIPVETSQWLVVSDIGLNMMQGPDGLHVFVRSLANAQPLAGVEVALVAASNRILGTATSDAGGHVKFDKPLTQGAAGAAPILVRADAPNLGFTFLPFSQGSFDLSDRGTSGRDDPGAVDGFAFTERGVYRPGETVHATALMRDPTGAALSGVPVTFRLERPDGIEAARVTRNDSGAGGYAADFPLALSSMTGQWTLHAHVDPGQPSVGRSTFLVEDFVPPTIEVKAESKTALAAPNQPVAVDVMADYLFGAPAGDLRVDARAIIRTASTPFPAYQGYYFGLIEEPFDAKFIQLGSTRTGADGRAPVGGTLNIVPDTTQPLEAEIDVSVFEVSGRAVSTSVVVPFSHAPVLIGVKPKFEYETVGEGQAAGFDVVAVGPDGAALDRAGISYVLYREDWSYVWFRRYDTWDYEVSVRDTPVARATVALAASGPAPIDVTPLDWGRYRLELVDPASGAATSMRFTAGWWVAPGSEGRPDVVNVRLDKQGYAVGDIAQVFIEPPYAGQLVLMRAGATLDVVHSGPIEKVGTTVPVTVDAQMLNGPGAYLLATVYRPGQDLSVAMPGRAIGVGWLAADAARRDIKLAIEAPAQMRPNGPLAVTLKAPDGGRSAFAVVAAVDDAVLGLTGYQTPDPLGYVMAQRRLAYEIRDTYGRLIDPRDAPRGVLKTGGDGMGALDASLAVRSTRVVSLFSGVVTFDEAGNATVSLDVPDFAGRLRVMAVAWSSDRLGNAQADVVVRDPLVATLSLPRFLAPKDQATTWLSIENVDAPQGDYTLAFEATGPIEVTSGATGPIKIGDAARTQVPVAVMGTGVGNGAIKLVLSGPEGLTIERHYEIAVRATANRERSTTFFTLAPSQQFQIAGGLLDRYLAGTSRATLTLNGQPDFGAGSHVQALYDYAYRCLEQSSSRGAGLLWGTPWRKDAGTEMADMIARVASLQRFDGAFGLWSSRADAEPWLSAFATEFLVRAKNAGHEVPEVTLGNAIAWLANQTAQPGEASYELSARAYAYYTLSSTDKGDLGRLRQFAETYTERLPGAIDAALLGAALARYGERDLAIAAFNHALTTTGLNVSPDDWFGTPIRERAAVAALLAESGVMDDRLPALVDDLRTWVGNRSYLSTQEMVWVIRAAATLQSRGTTASKATLGTELREFTEPLIAVLNEAQQKGGLAITNNGEGTLFGMLDVIGTPSATPLPVETNGLVITREYLKTDGSPLAGNKLRQGDLVIVRVSGRSEDVGNHHVLLVDLLPAGLEIENPQLGGGDMLKNMPWLATLSVVDYAASRDDRFVAALRLYGQASFEVAYLARAVTPGNYALPGPYIESMYRPDIFGIGPAGALTVSR